MAKSRTKFFFWVWLVEFTAQKTRRHAKNPLGEVWRNLCLVSARSEREAITKALKIGRSSQGDAKGSLRLDGKPAITEFLGIEDIGLIHEPLEDGAEILFRSSRSRRSTVRPRCKPAKALLAALKREFAPYRRS